MINAILKKLKESTASVLPIVALVIILDLTSLINLTSKDTVSFLVSSIFLIIGIALFNIGADMSMTQMGEHIGSGLTRLRSLAILLSVCFAMGIFITIAEPDLAVLANQVSDIMNSTLLIVTVGAGVGLCLVIAILKIVFRKQLPAMLMFTYMLAFALAALLISRGQAHLIPLSFDSGGVTTGPITVPFIMALGVGIATAIGGKNSGENSFGIIALCSIGPILAVLLLGCLSSGDGAPLFSIEYSVNVKFSYIIHILLETLGEVALALSMVVAFFLILQAICLKLPKKKLIQIFIGLIYTLTGLVMFLSAVKLVYMPIGYEIGYQLSASQTPLIIFSLVLGMTVVLAEPAVHVLNKQVEEITEGTVSRRSMMIALSVGVGLSICLSIIRIIYDFSVLYYLIPGFCISLGLSFFVPGIYTAIAFDSGGVASGPLTSSFILPFAIGACCCLGGPESVLINAFGIVAMVAMAPLITIQLLGFKSIMTRKINEKLAINRILRADDEQIIDFM